MKNFSHELKKYVFLHVHDSYLNDLSSQWTETPCCCIIFIFLSQNLYRNVFCHIFFYICTTLTWMTPFSIHWTSIHFHHNRFLGIKFAFKCFFHELKKSVFLYLHESCFNNSIRTLKQHELISLQISCHKICIKMFSYELK